MPRSLALLTALLLLATAGSAQQEPPTFRTSVDAVEIDAFVTDRQNNTVPNLTIDDFEVSEDGRPQRITSFSEVSIPIVPPQPYSPTAAQPDVATNAAGEGRLYVIVFDEVHPLYALKARHFLHTFIEEHFEPNDIGIVVSVGRARTGDMQDFTGNRRLLLAAIDKFSGGFPNEDDQSVDGAIGQPLRQSGTVRQQAAALKSLMESLADIRGRRKAVLYVTQSVGESA